jgi:glycerophosphoryl diester phosphodiesterase
MIIIGHRGARGLAPENTLTSIKEALAYDVDEVEIDVRVTRDGVSILNHDRAIIVEDKVLRIAAHSLQELRAVKPDIATLAEALKLVAGRSVLLIEVKHGEPISPVVQDIQHLVALSRQIPSILLSSKSQRVLKELHQALPQIPKVIVEPWSGIRATYRARQLGTKRIGMRSWWLWKGFLKSMARRGYQVVPYTMNNPQRVAKWEPYMYGIYTDYPDRFKSKSN